MIRVAAWPNMRHLLFPLVVTLAVLQPSAAVRHIVFILVDDLGWNDVGFHNPNVISPNIDRLAKGGVILNSSYVMPTCTPSRHALMTGFYPFKAGLQRGALFPQHSICTPTDLRLLPQNLKELDYSTHIIGKWHLGYCNWNCTPTHRGFDTFLGFYNGMEDYYNKTLLGGTDFRDDDSRAMTETYSAEVFSNRAVDIINKHDSSKPLFLYMPYQSVHFPVQVPKKYEDMYPDVKDDMRRKYLGMVSALDEGIGNVTKALEETGLMKDTLIVFTADNGGMVNEGGNNYPLRGAKTTVYEGGTRAAAFVYGSGIQKTGYTYDGMMHVVDWNPTIIAAAGGNIPPGIDGINQWNAISTGGESGRTEFVYNLDPAILAPTGHAAIREGDFKLIQGFPGIFWDWYKPPESNNYTTTLKYKESHSKLAAKRFYFYEVLFNLREDPNEHNDVSKSYPDVVKRLRAKLDDYRKDMVTPDMTTSSESDPSNYGGYWSPGWC